MGQKTHPLGLRLGIIKTWNSSWFDEKDFSGKLQEDLQIRKYVRNRLDNAAVSKIGIDRTAKKILISIDPLHRAADSLARTAASA